MTVMIKIMDLVKFLIYYFNVEGIEITPLKLQKILYYIQAWHLVFFNKHSLFSEAPEALVNGPVYRCVYNYFKQRWFKNNPVLINLSNEKLVDGLKDRFDKLNLNDEQQNYLNAVLKKYGQLSSGHLVYLTHAEDPWNKTREGFGIFDKCDRKISFDLMYEYYNKKRLNKNQ